MIALRRQARTAIKNEDFVSAANIFAQMASEQPAEIDLFLQAARCYEKADAPEQAAVFYLRAAKLYINLGIGVQSVALLRKYRDLRPDDHDTCLALFRFCRTQTSEPKELVDMLDDDDKARYSMRYGEIFSALDDENFDALFDDMKVRELAEGETLVRTGDKADSLFLVAEGCLQAWMIRQGQRLSLGKIGAGGVCGEVPLFTGIKRRTGDLVACMPTRLVEISYGLLQGVQQKSPVIAQRIDRLYHKHLLERHLALSPFFGQLSPQLRQEIARKIRVVRIQAGKTLFRQGDHSCDIWQIRSGKLLVSISVENHSLTIKEVSSGDVIGEIAVANDGVRSASLQVLEDAVLLCWSGRDVQAAWRRHEDLRHCINERKTTWEKDSAQRIAQWQESKEAVGNRGA